MKPDKKVKGIYEEYDLTDKVGQSLLEINLKKTMKNGMFKLDWANIKSAIVYGLLTMAVVFLLSVVESILKAGSIFGIDWRHVTDTATIAALSLFVVGLSLVKNLLTTNTGHFLGVVKVIPEDKS